MRQTPAMPGVCNHLRACCKGLQSGSRYLCEEVVTVAEVARVIVGTVRCEPREDYVYLGRLAVAPPWRGRGIGQRLIEAVMV